MDNNLLRKWGRSPAAPWSWGLMLVIGLAGVPAAIAGIFLGEYATGYQAEAFSAAIGGLLALAGLLPAGYGIVLSRSTIRLDQGRFLRGGLHVVFVMLIATAILAGLGMSFAGLSLGSEGPWQLLLGASAALTLIVAFWSPLLFMNLLSQTSARSTTAYAVREILRCEQRGMAERVTSLTKDLRDIGLEEWKKGDRRALHERLRGLLTVVARSSQSGPPIAGTGRLVAEGDDERTAADQARDEFIFISESVIEDRDHAEFALSLIEGQIDLDGAEMVVCSIWAAAAEREASRRVKKKAATVLFMRHEHLSSAVSTRGTELKEDWDRALEILRKAITANSDAVSVRMAIEVWIQKDVFSMQSPQHWLEFLSVDQGRGYAHYYDVFREDVFQITSGERPSDVAGHICAHPRASSLLPGFVAACLRADGGGPIAAEVVGLVADRCEEIGQVADQFVEAAPRDVRSEYPTSFTSDLAIALARVLPEAIAKANPSNSNSNDLLPSLAQIVSSAIVGLRCAGVPVEKRIELYEQLGAIREGLKASWSQLFATANWRFDLVQSVLADIESLATANSSTPPSSSSISCASLLELALSGMADQAQTSRRALDQRNAEWCSKLVLSTHALQKVGGGSCSRLPVEALVRVCALDTSHNEADATFEDGRYRAMALVTALLGVRKSVDLHERLRGILGSSDFAQLQRLQPLFHQLDEEEPIWNSALRAWWLVFLNRCRSANNGSVDAEFESFLPSRGFSVLLSEWDKTSWNNGVLEPLSASALDYLARTPELPPNLCEPVSRLLSVVLKRKGGLPQERDALIRRVKNLDVLRILEDHLPPD